MNRLMTKAIAAHMNEIKKHDRFKGGVTPVPVSGKVFDEQEITQGIEAVLDGWWTEGRWAEQFEKEFRAILGVRYVSLVNSGSSANLVALTALTSPIFGARALKPGDEIITTATGFPTTVNPIIQNGCIPVFIDNDIHTANATIQSIKKAISKKTKGIMMAHTLGNPLPLGEIMKLVEQHRLWFVEDCCDALGSRYDGKPTGSFGHVATFSFYPAHQITMGEGGAVVTNNPLVHRSIRQIRDWGRDCWCDTGKDNTCARRFGWQLGDLPLGYDHKYIYSQIGYNLKLTDMQAAIGLAQLGKLKAFIKKRKDNFRVLYEFFSTYKNYFILPKWEDEADPAWFGFMIVVADGAPFTRLDLVHFLEERKVATRSLFAGNLLKHPAYKTIKHRVVGSLKSSDKIMRDGLWIGVWPGITPTMRTYIMKSIAMFIDLQKKKVKTKKK